MMRQPFYLLALPILLVLLPQAAAAHPGHVEGSGFVQGFQHPVGGIDHVLAMVAVGLLAALRGGRALWALPLAFLGLMGIGAVLGGSGFALPFAEIGIALSIVVFGLMAMFGLSLPVSVMTALVGALAVFHGYAHGAEMPETGSGSSYGVGFLLATACLHLLGIGLGWFLARGSLIRTAPLLGGLVTISGFAILILQF